MFYDRSFSLDDYLQAQDRIHRISQDRECHIYNLIMADSVDEWVDVLLAAKHMAAKLGQGDIDVEAYGAGISYEFAAMLKTVLGDDINANA
jgi:SNF2 family DNA or RNA helicase